MSLETEPSDLLIATDEAGYGPNLGPLVIVATCWRVPQGDGLEECARAMTTAVDEWNGGHTEERLHIGDSKEVYRQGKGMPALEVAVLAALAALSKIALPSDGRSLSRTVCHDDLSIPDWMPGESTPVPIVAALERIDETKMFWQNLSHSAGIELLGVCADIIFPRQWNALLDRFQNKSTVLTHRTLELVRRIVADPAGACGKGNDGRCTAGGDSATPRMRLVCDKHGGRNHYHAFLVDALGDWADSPWIAVDVESADCSRYRLTRGASELLVDFHCKADRWAPVGFSSMVAKYLREVFMTAFNRFWRGHCPELRPTAGYPSDAKRFCRDIEPVRQRLGIHDDDFWRRK